MASTRYSAPVRSTSVPGSRKLCSVRSFLKGGLVRSTEYSVRRSVLVEARSNTQDCLLRTSQGGMSSYYGVLRTEWSAE